MDFMEIAGKRQSCRSYDSREVEPEKIQAMLEAARLAPSACNGQPFHFTVCRGGAARAVAAATQAMGMNKFASDAPVLIVISEDEYGKTASIVATGGRAPSIVKHCKKDVISDQNLLMEGLRLIYNRNVK